MASDTTWEFPPHVLREYALLADGERGVLLGPRGDVAWMCAPRWDSDAVFSSLIGGHGIYAVTPAGRFVWGGYYEDGSLIWRSRWITETGIVECREALAFPGEPGRAVVLRRIIACAGQARLRVLLDPRAGFGHHRIRSLSLADDIWTGRTGPLHIRWIGGGQARPGAGGHDDHTLAMELTLAAGEHHDLVLELSEQTLPDVPPDPGQAWEATAYTWNATVPELSGMIARSDARHSYAVLRGLTSAGGGMVAAATMSLPERADAGRNYDYRYAWIRDQSYAGLAAAAVGATDLLHGAVAFITQRLLADGPQLKPAYTVDGEPVPSEQSLDLPGYPGGTDKLGNWVNQQFQLDAFGESLQLLATAAREGQLDADAERAIHTAVDAIERRWTDDDAGIWELDNRQWTQSRLACVAGLRAIAGAPAAGVDVTRCTSLADTILARTARTSLDPDGHWLRQPGQDGTDASLLLPPVRGALPADDPRTVATLHAVRRELSRDYYVYRFRHDQRDLGAAEGAFLLCGFMMALAEHHHGDPLRAVRYFERNRAACGPAGLLSEEFDVTQRQLRGNLPQAFVHALLLECAGRLTDDGLTRGKSGKPLFPSRQVGGGPDLQHRPRERRDRRS